jgi:hypothetical protein
VQRTVQPRPLVAGARYVILLAAIAALAAVPHTALESLPSLCLWHHLGLPCWGCGTVRALSAFLHGDLASAWRHNHNIVLTAPLLAILLYGSLKRMVRLYVRPWSSQL